MISKTMYYFILFLAIVFEVIGTLCLKPNIISSLLLQVVIVVFSYSCSFGLLYVILKHLPVGVVYATWAGLGIVSVALFGKFFYKENLDLAAWAGILLIISGVMVLNLISKSSVE